MKSLDKKKPKELECWEKEFDWTMLNQEDHSFDETYSYIDSFIKKLLTQQRTELLEEIIRNLKDIEIGEADGWELARKFNCCPGDDMADAYNQALKDVIKLIKKL